MTVPPGTPTQHKPRPGRTPGALAGVFVVVAAAGMFALPASALAAPTSRPSIAAVPAPPAASSGPTSPGEHGAGGVNGQPGDVNIAMLATVASLGLAIGLPLAGKARIARWRCVRRFRAKLRNVDTVEVCLEEINRH